MGFGNLNLSTSFELIKMIGQISPFEQRRYKQYYKPSEINYYCFDVLGKIVLVN